MSSVLRGSFNFLWDLNKPLGQGATSMVYRGRNKSTGEEVAVKVFTQAGNLRPKDVQMREYAVMAKLKHNNIVALLAIEEEQGTHNKVIVMELTDHGSLFNLLEDPRNAYGLPEEEFLIVFQHVSAGMKCIKDNGIVHRDIKPGNILRYIGEDGRSVYRLTDFGAAKQLETEEEQFMSLYGTEEYLHPDIYERAVLRTPNRRQFTSTVDLWSLGVTFFHVATGQLPFKPFGGRKNRAKMFEITRTKDSGVIMGVQLTEGGPIEWSRDLPPTCRLSLGLKLLLTPIFAKLLESNPARVWNFDEFFQSVDSIIHKKVMHIFNPHSWSNLCIYINGESKLSELQELIAAQTDIVSSNQILLFDGQPLKECVPPLMPVCSYPNGITDRNPIFCFTRNVEDSCRFPQTVIRDFPKFSATVTSEDYPISKMCSAIACYIHEEVKRYNAKQELMRRSVLACVQELYHECSHLVDYQVFLERNCNSTLKWKDDFLRTIVRELSVLQILFVQVKQGQEPLAELETFHATCCHRLERATTNVDQLREKIASHLPVLKDQQLQKKQLRKQWNDSIGCTNEDLCISKVNVVVDCILKIKAQFHEDRKKVSLSFNEEQIHKYEKNKLSENCIKVRSLFYDHCVRGASNQFNQFHTWYREACEVRQQNRLIEGWLAEMADSLETFVTIMSELCYQFHDIVTRLLRNVEDKIEDCVGEQFISLHTASPHTSRAEVHSRGLSRSASSATFSIRDKRCQVLKSMIDSLEGQKHSLDVLKKDLNSNSQLIHGLSTLLQDEGEKFKFHQDF